MPFFTNYVPNDDEVVTLKMRDAIILINAADFLSSIMEFRAGWKNNDDEPVMFPLEDIIEEVHRRMHETIAFHKTRGN